MDCNRFEMAQLRRDFLRQCVGGVGVAALAHLMGRDGLAVPKVNPLAPKPPHFGAKAKNVIFMFMEGGPSQYELFYEKPALKQYHGQSLPPSMTKDMRLAFIKPNAAVMARTGSSSCACG